ncbi:hypothetical protein LTR10_022445 [Elasticomyces elasticus]|uniref:Cytochrome P450 n=1 Tax=Exophiala sideris TaxID=1016849 RepID=A0ABR0J2T3_9EURO|nr:hypothetical protein LTR10_022445 [Elasticomyces elasticus]KAK5024881.1 hypothetical protein LTS07_008259 [Exophiala sideris]KAK5031529.1 hypothetical protein LTR13_007857 [Exophiala sideris]KAK5054920.1 hypothetical protein LTR69_008488 [Exophiala sideris]KAK5179799.1 hypothetical protein LTR44_007615 [Eurotiomycetes sp. CCFEE 6388]
MGPIVRVGPREIAVNTSEGVKTIQKVQRGFAKSEWYDKTGPGLIGMRDREKHSHRRRLLAHPLSNTALQDFEPLVQAMVDLAMEKIRHESRRLGHADVYKWFGLMATDIIGDLTFGSSFRMLEQGRGNQYTDDLQSTLHQVHMRIVLYPLLDILAYLPLKQAREVGEKFKRIGGYGKESMKRLKHAQATGALLLLYSSEALRLYGTASGSHHCSVPAGGWQIEDYYLPPSTVVTSQAYSLHRRPETFEEPFSFKPERWLDPTAEMQMAFIPFGERPRICIGINLAYVELRLTTAAFFRAFKGAVVDPALADDDMHLENYTLISPKGRKCLVQV